MLGEMRLVTDGTAHRALTLWLDCRSTPPFLILARMGCTTAPLALLALGTFQHVHGSARLQHTHMQPQQQPGVEWVYPLGSYRIQDALAVGKRELSTHAHLSIHTHGSNALPNLLQQPRSTCSTPLMCTVAYRFSCCRWLNQLNPNVKKGPFSPEEDAAIMAAHNIFGNKWASIAKLLPGRCVACAQHAHGAAPSSSGSSC